MPPREEGHREVKHHPSRVGGGEIRPQMLPLVFYRSTKGAMMQVADYKGVISDLRMKRNALEHEMKRLDDIISELERMTGKAALQSSLTASARPFRGETLKASIEAVLDSGREFLAIKDVIARLEQGGLESKAKRLYPSVYSTLFRMSEDDGPVVKSKDGKWGLRKWQNQA